MHLPSYKEAKTTDKREYEEKKFELNAKYKNKFLGKKCFLKTLNGIYHERIEYPKDERKTVK